MSAHSYFSRPTKCIAGRIVKLYVDHCGLCCGCTVHCCFVFNDGFCLTERFNGEWSRGRINLSRTGCFSFSVRCVCQGQEHVAVHAVFHHTVFPATVGAVKTLLTVLLSLGSVLAPQQGTKPGYVIRIPVGRAWLVYAVEGLLTP